MQSGCDQECTYDTQCSQGAICLSGECRTTCTASEVCAGKDECIGEWSPSDQDFTRSAICDEPTCDCADPAATCVLSGGQRACVILGEQCAAGSVCEGEGRCGALGLPGCVCESGDCGPRCSRDEHCGDDLACDNRRCTTVSCSDDDDCGEGEFCGVDLAGTTPERVCLTIGEKAAGADCDENAECQSRVCGGDSANPVCLELCQDDADCDRPSRCVLGGPLTGVALGVCLEVDQCSEDETAIWVGAAIGCTREQACETEADCLEPLACVDGSCACLECAGECSTDADCPDAFTCTDGDCRLRATCTDRQDCDTDQSCVSWLGSDVAVTYCVGTGELELGAACDRPEDCQTGFCNDVCTLPCETTRDCPDAACAVGNDGRGYCSLADCPCRDEELCGGGLCAETAACLRNADCEPDEDCVNGICLRECTRGSDCRAGHDCVRLEGTADYCVGGEDRCNCSPGELCIAGECRVSSPCNGDADCGNSTCVAGHCFETCEVNADCSGETECVARILDGRLVRGCSTAQCHCGDEEAWCLGNSAGFGTCFLDENCDACGERPGYECARLDTPLRWEGEAVSRACRCEDPSVCGARCEQAADCPVELDLECAAFGRCAPMGSCLSTGDCDALWDCVRDPDSDTALGVCARADCGCGPEATCVADEGVPACVVGSGCSVLEQDCPDGYECDPRLGLCECRDRELCAPRCERDAECVPSQLCRDGVCEPVACSAPDDCPDDSVCGGVPGNLTCFQPGSTAEAGLCDSARDCRSGYCFAGNSCALFCGGTVDCPAQQTCQRVDPETFVSELPVCHAGSTLCDSCRDDQYCDNDPEEPRCLPECRTEEHCAEGQLCVEGVCQP